MLILTFELAFVSDAGRQKLVLLPAAAYRCIRDVVERSDPCRQADSWPSSTVSRVLLLPPFPRPALPGWGRSGKWLQLAEVI
jgi:hypothetical protein